MFPSTDFPSIAAAIEDGINRRLHTGVQIYVSRNGAVVLDSALGESAPGRTMTSSTVMPWRSAGKPLTALLILRKIEAGKLTLATILGEILPESLKTDKASVTLFDLLTHQSGFSQTDVGWPHVDWATSVQRALETPRQFEIGTAAYHPQSSWFLLGEILRWLEPATTLTSFSELLKRDLLDPLQLSETICGVSTDVLRDVANRLPTLYEREQGQLLESVYSGEPWINRTSPGGNLRGPVRELGRFYEMLLRNGQLSNGVALVAEATVRQMTSRQRVAEYDQTLQHVVDFGLGVICSSNRYGADTVPYGFGRFCSDDSFGHGGSQCSMGFCDPQQNLVVTWSSNGFCGEGQHQRRNRLINEAVYLDLGMI